MVENKWVTGVITPRENNQFAPENGWLEHDCFLSFWGKRLFFQGIYLAVSFKEGISPYSYPDAQWDMVYLPTFTPKQLPSFVGINMTSPIQSHLGDIHRLG